MGSLNNFQFTVIEPLKHTKTPRSWRLLSNFWGGFTRSIIPMNAMRLAQPRNPDALSFLLRIERNGSYSPDQ